MGTKNLIIGSGVLVLGIACGYLYNKNRKPVVPVVTSITTKPSEAALLYLSTMVMDGTDGDSYTTLVTDVLRDNGYRLIANPNYGKPNVGQSSNSNQTDEQKTVIVDANGNIIPYPTSYMQQYL